MKNLEEGLNGLGVEQRPSRAPPSTLIVSAETDGCTFLCVSFCLPCTVSCSHSLALSSSAVARLRLEGQQKRRLDLQPQRNERYRQYIQYAF